MRGFTIIELMVTLAVLSAIAAAAFVGIRQDEYKNQYRRFVDDVEGAIVHGRNFAIDEQRRVRVDFEATSVTVTAFNPVDATWELVERKALTNANGQLLLTDNNVCIYGLISGVQTPSQAESLTLPSACLGALQRLEFEPDGRFIDPENAFMTEDNAGVSLWIANRQIEGTAVLSVIEIWPGGLIRSFRDLQGDEA